MTNEPVWPSELLAQLLERKEKEFMGLNKGLEHKASLLPLAASPGFVLITERKHHHRGEFH